MSICSKGSHRGGGGGERKGVGGQRRFGERRSFPCQRLRPLFYALFSVPLFQKTSRRLRWSRSRTSRSVPEGGADFPAAIFLAGKCPNSGRDSISWCRKIGEEFSSSVEICRKTLPTRNFGQSEPSRVSDLTLRQF